MGRETYMSILSRVGSRQERGPRGTAYRVRDIGVGVSNSCSGQRVQMRRVDARFSVASEVSAIVFRDDKQDIRAMVVFRFGADAKVVD